MQNEGVRRVHWEADVFINGGQIKTLEVYAFTGDHAFDCEEAAVEAAERNAYDGYQIRMVETVETVVRNVRPQ